MVKLGEKALHMKSEFSGKSHGGACSRSSWSSGKGRGRGYAGGKNRSYGGRGRSFETKTTYNVFNVRDLGM